MEKIIQTIFPLEFMIRNIDFLINCFLDNSTKHIIHKYYTPQSLNILQKTRKNNIKYKIVGLKIFLLFKQIGKKTSLNLKKIQKLKITFVCQIERQLFNFKHLILNNIIITNLRISLRIFWKQTVSSKKIVLERLQRCFKKIKYNQNICEITILGCRLYSQIILLTKVIYASLCEAFVYKISNSRKLYQKILKLYTIFKQCPKQKSDLTTNKILSQSSRDRRQSITYDFFQQKKLVRSMKSDDNIYRRNKRISNVKIGESQEIEKNCYTINQLSSNQEISEIIKPVDETIKNTTNLSEFFMNYNQNI